MWAEPKSILVNESIDDVQKLKLKVEECEGREKELQIDKCILKKKVEQKDSKIAEMEKQALAIYF